MSVYLIAFAVKFLVSVSSLASKRLWSLLADNRKAEQWLDKLRKAIELHIFLSTPDELPVYNETIVANENCFLKTCHVLYCLFLILHIVRYYNTQPAF